MISPKVIGEGRYGCVHKPSLKCNNDTFIQNYDGKISKIMTSRSASKEMSQYTEIRSIDPQQKYHISPQRCTPKKGKYLKKQVSNCDINGEEILKNLDDYDLIVMNDGGKDLFNIFNQTTAKTHNKEFIRDFWIQSVTLFKAVQLFGQHNIVHHDLKPDNIVYDTVKKSLKIIDFGLSRNKNYIIKHSIESTYGLSIFHYNFPPEMFFYNKNKFNNIHSFDDKSEKLLNISVKTFNSFVYCKFLTQFEDYFLDTSFEFIDNQDKLKYDDFINKSIDTIDLFGLGFTLMFVLANVYTLMDLKITLELYSLFKSMVSNVIGR